MPDIGALTVSSSQKTTLIYRRSSHTLQIPPMRVVIRFSSSSFASVARSIPTWFVQRNRIVSALPAFRKRTHCGARPGKILIDSILKDWVGPCSRHRVKGRDRLAFRWMCAPMCALRDEGRVDATKGQSQQFLGRPVSGRVGDLSTDLDRPAHIPRWRDSTKRKAGERKRRK